MLTLAPHARPQLLQPQPLHLLPPTPPIFIMDLHYSGSPPPPLVVGPNTHPFHSLRVRRAAGPAEFEWTYPRGFFSLQPCPLYPWPHRAHRTAPSPLISSHLIRRGNRNPSVNPQCLLPAYEDHRHLQNPDGDEHEYASINEGAYTVLLSANCIEFRLQTAHICSAPSTPWS